MLRPARILVAFAATFLISLAGCASPKAPPPVDPTKEQIAILQKQLLELQTAQNETRKKLDEQMTLISSLSDRVKSAEDRLALPPQKQTSSNPTAPAKKDAKGSTKKKKPVRRQEP